MRYKAQCPYNCCLTVSAVCLVHHGERQGFSEKRQHQQTNGGASRRRSHFVETCSRIICCHSIYMVRAEGDIASVVSYARSMKKPATYLIIGNAQVLSLEGVQGPYIVLQRRAAQPDHPRALSSPAKALRPDTLGIQRSRADTPLRRAGRFRAP